MAGRSAGTDGKLQGLRGECSNWAPAGRTERPAQRVLPTSLGSPVQDMHPLVCMGAECWKLGLQWTDLGKGLGFAAQRQPGDLPNPGMEPRSPALQGDSLPAEPQGKPKNTGVGSLSLQGIFPTQGKNPGTPEAEHHTVLFKKKKKTERKSSLSLQGTLGSQLCPRICLP